MSGDVTLFAITPADDAALKNAVKNLEGRNFAAKLADYAGVPVNRVLGFLPKAVNRHISGMARNAVMKGLEVAVDTLDEKPPRTPAIGFSSFLAGVTGGVGGLGGEVFALVLRDFGNRAQHEGRGHRQLDRERAESEHSRRGSHALRCLPMAPSRMREMSTSAITRPAL
jgi:hypothetical protein